jgi:predicted alpha/beta-fold hydrolase
VTVFEEQARRKAAVMAMLEAHPFRAPWWLKNRHLQTGWNHFFRRLPAPNVRQERWDTPDEDFVDVYLDEGRTDRPAVLMLHGLEGSVRSKYIVGLQHAFAEIGWGTAALEFRSCGGEINRARRLYHSGETTDLAFVAERLTRRWPGRRLYVVGYSLGGNVTAKWLGEDPDAVPEAVAGAAVVGVPFDLAGSAGHFERSLRGAYSRHFMRRLIPKAVEKARQYPGVMDLERVRRSRSFADFDTHATAALHGFRDAEDYWARSSSGQFLGNVRKPLLLISAMDDPFNPPETLPWAAAVESPYLHPLFTREGGHVGFVYGLPWAVRHWAEEQIVRFFEAYEGMG